MILSDTTDKTGIIQSIERKINMGDGYISGDATRLAEMLATINEIVHRVWHLIFISAGNWIFDDNNQENLPQATYDLEDGTAKYLLPVSTLTIKRMEIKDESGNWHKLTPLAEHDIPTAIDEFQKGDGQPVYYRLIGQTIELFPSPAYDAEDGLKVYFDRDSIDLSDDEDAPGFASPYHEIVPIGASIEWLKIKNPTAGHLGLLIADYQKFEKGIVEFYQNRFKDYKPRLTRKKEFFK